MRNYILKNFPFLEDDFDALTDYELFSKMVGYMKKMSKQFDIFQQRLDKYENYFNNLDVQEEINNKLDEMYQSGELSSLVSDFLALKSTYTYDTVADMKLAENFINGCYAKTLGYNTLNDGGSAYYYIRDKEESDTIDDVFILSLYDETLVAQLIIINNEVNVKQGGLTGDSDDATDILEILVASGYNLYFPSGTYNITTQMDITCHSIRGDGNTSIIKYNDDLNNGQLLECSDITNLDIKDLCFDCGEATDATKTAINIYDGQNVNILNCEFKNGYGSHLRLNGSDNILIENSYFHDISGATGNMGNAIYCHPATNLLINNCKCNNLMEDFLYLDGDDTHIVKNVIVKNCYLKNTSHNNPSIVSNCIGINGYCDNVTVASCILTNNGAGIRCQARSGFTPSNIFIYDNRISDNIQNGINITADDAFIHDNIIYNNPQDGCYILSSTNINFNSNIVHNSGRYGVWFRGCDYVSINDNRIYDNSTAGLLMGSSEDYPINYATVTNNEVYKTEDGTQATGIQIIHGDDVKVLSCHSYNNVVNYDINKATTTNFISQFNPIYGKDDIRSFMYSNGVPLSGTYRVGDVVLFTNPTAGGNIGAVCTTAGTPGTWKTFGDIES